MPLVLIEVLCASTPTSGTDVHVQATTLKRYGKMTLFVKPEFTYTEPLPIVVCAKYLSYGWQMYNKMWCLVLAIFTLGECEPCKKCENPVLTAQNERESRETREMRKKQENNTLEPTHDCLREHRKERRRSVWRSRSTRHCADGRASCPPAAISPSTPADARCGGLRSQSLPQPYLPPLAAAAASVPQRPRAPAPRPLARYSGSRAGIASGTAHAGPAAAAGAAAAARTIARNQVAAASKPNPPAMVTGRRPNQPRDEEK